MEVNKSFNMKFLQDLMRGRCDSLDAATLCEKDGRDPMTFDPEASEPAFNLEPSPAELAQCEAEVGSLLSIIAELNKTMGSLKAPSDPGDMRVPTPSRPLVPDLLSHQLVRSSPERNSACRTNTTTPLTTRGVSGVVWNELQEVLSSVEESISFRRTWAAPITQSDRDKHKEHLRAAQDNWVKASTILEEMEREFGISCPFGPPKELYQEDGLDAEKRETGLRLSSQSVLNAITQVEEEKNKLISLHNSWRSGSISPSYRSSAAPLSPDWASPPFPGSPLLHRRSSRATAPLTVAVDPLGSVNSGGLSPISLEAETERLNRHVDRLKARNERLTAALERRKSESEQINATLSRLESDCSALQTALRYCEECEEAYGELLSLYDAKKQQSIPPQTDSAESDGDKRRPDSPSAPLRNTGAEELSTSFSTAGVTEETQTHSHMGHRINEPADREAALRQQIERLKRERAAISLPRPGLGLEGLERCGPSTKDNKTDTKKEKAAFFYELISVREEMSDLRALIRLKEKELRCLEWSLMSQKAQEAAGAFIPESLREELEDRKTEQQRLCEAAAKLGCDGDINSPRARPILKELQAVLHREQALKKRLALVQDSLSPADCDGSTQRRDSEEQIARLTQAHSKALSSYRQIRRKYREQVWRLEQKVAAMAESQRGAGGATRAAGEASEWRREETVL